jgi:hypothetical protein
MWPKKQNLTGVPSNHFQKKKDYQSRHGLLQEQIMVGWNMCIDAILKGGEIDE